MMNQTGPNYMDPRSTVGILGRGQNVYQGASFSPKVGQGNMQNFQGVAQQQLLNPAKIPAPNSMNNVNYQQVAKWLQAQSMV